MLKKLDIWVVLSCLGLALFSLFTLLGISNDYFLIQIVFFIAGFIVFFIALRLGVDFFRLNSLNLYIGFVVALLVTFLLGDFVRGSRRWIHFYFFNIQPSEFFKPFFVLFLADLLASKMDYFKKAVVSFVLFIIPVSIILIQPDLGTSLIYIGVYSSLLFFAGLPLSYFINGGIAMLLLSPVAWWFLHDYQKSRIISFIRPQEYASDLSYNLIQSIITVGSGAFIGRGLGLGTQSRFLFLPENHTDFAFASLVEQFGFIGGITVIFLFAVIIYRLLLRTRTAKPDRFRYFFMVGTILYILIPVFFNIGMNLGLLPVAGIALPLVSYGGSSIVSTLMLIGFALSI